MSRRNRSSRAKFTRDSEKVRLESTRDDHLSHLRQSPIRATKQDLRTNPPQSQKSRSSNQHCRNQPHNRRHRLRDRPRLRQGERLQRENGHGITGSNPLLTRLREPKIRPSRTSRPGQMLPPLHQIRLPQRTRRLDHAGDPTHESQQRRPAAQIPRHQRARRLRLHGRPTSRNPHPRL